MARSDRVRLGVCPEVTFATDPSASGSLYLPMPADDAPLFQWDQQLEPDNYSTGRVRHQGEHMSSNGSTVPFSMPMMGLSAAATDLAPTPVANDYQDTILDSAFSLSTNMVGEGIAASGSSTSIVVQDVANLAADDMVLVNHATRGEWRYVTSISTVTANTTPVMSVIPSAVRDVNGYKAWRYNENNGGPTLAAYQEVDGVGYMHLGGKPTALKIAAESGKEARYQGSLMFDRKSRLGSLKASFPAGVAFTNPTIRFTLSEIFWGTTAIPVKKIEIDFRLKTVPVLSSDALNGRGTMEVHNADPRITIEPAFTSSLEDDFEIGTTRNLLIAFGSGNLTGGRVSTVCFFAFSAQIKKVQLLKDGGYLRQQIILDVVDPGIRTGSTAYRYWSLCRA